MLSWESLEKEDPCFYCAAMKCCLWFTVSSSKRFCVLQLLIAAKNIHNLWRTMMNTLLMNLREGLITPHTRVTFEIQFMLRSQQFKIIAFHISYGDIAGSGRLVFFYRPDMTRHPKPICFYGKWQSRLSSAVVEWVSSMWLVSSSPVTAN